MLQFLTRFYCIFESILTAIEDVCSDLWVDWCWCCYQPSTADIMICCYWCKKEQNLWSKNYFSLTYFNIIFEDMRFWGYIWFWWPPIRRIWGWCCRKHSSGPFFTLFTGICSSFVFLTAKSGEFSTLSTILISRDNFILLPISFCIAIFLKILLFSSTTLSFILCL